MAVDRHAGVACAGLVPDGRQLAFRARAECANYASFFGDRIPARVLADRLASYMHLYTLYWSVRPYGATAVMATCDPDKNEPLLFVAEPTGVCHSYRACACGRGRQSVRTDLERLDLETLTTDAAIKEVAKLMLKAKDESSKRETEIEMAVIGTATNGIFQRVPDNVVQNAVDVAKAEIDADMEDD